MSWKKTLLICFIILIVGGAVTTLIFSTEPTAERSGATRETAMLVDVTSIQKGSFHPTITAMGTVIPSQDIILSPRVSGEVIDRSENFTPGGYVQKGDTLLRIDPADYRNALQQQQSQLQEALANLSIEMGRQSAAQKEYKLFGDTLSEENEALILREPQLNTVKSQVQSARAAVEQAKLDLARTTIKAPFDAHILNRNVNVGSQVAPGENLGRLVGLETYWVEATVPLSNLRRLNVPSDGGQGSEVRIRNRTAWSEDEYRTGNLFQLVGTLENQTRMARVLIEVKDPHGYQSNTNTSELPPLMLGSFVEANIKGEELSNVIRVNRDYIRNDDTVWTMEEGQLRIKDVNVVFRDAQYAYISSGLAEDDHVVTTNLSTVTDGAPLRLAGSESGTGQDQEDTESEISE